MTGPDFAAWRYGLGMTQVAAAAALRVSPSCVIENESAYDFSRYEQDECNALIKKIARWKHELDADRAKLPRGDVALMDAHDDAICHLLNAIDEIAERRRKADRAVDSWEMAQGSKAWTA